MQLITQPSNFFIDTEDTRNNPDTPCPGASEFEPPEDEQNPLGLWVSVPPSLGSRQVILEAVINGERIAIDLSPAAARHVGLLLQDAARVAAKAVLKTVE